MHRIGRRWPNAASIRITDCHDTSIGILESKHHGFTTSVEPPAGDVGVGWDNEGGRELHGIDIAVRQLLVRQA